MISTLVKISFVLKISLFKFSICSSIISFFLLEFPYFWSNFSDSISNLLEVEFVNSIKVFAELIISDNCDFWCNLSIPSRFFFTIFNSVFWLERFFILSWDVISWLLIRLISCSNCLSLFSNSSFCLFISDLNSSLWKIFERSSSFLRSSEFKFSESKLIFRILFLLMSNSPVSYTHLTLPTNREV